MSALTGIAILSRYVRSQMLEVIQEDYVRTARAKGLDEDRVIYGHALRNALLAVRHHVRLLAAGHDRRLGDLRADLRLAGARPARLRGHSGSRFPTILTLNFFAAALTLIGVLISDLLYAVVDPRIRLS